VKNKKDFFRGVISKQMCAVFVVFPTAAAAEKTGKIEIECMAKIII
jgi:hypothetical protein